MKKSPGSSSVSLIDWESIQEQEADLLRGLTIQDGLQQYLELQASFEYQMSQTIDIFAADRRKAIIELQERLQQLANWQMTHGKTFSFDPDDPKTPP